MSTGPFLVDTLRCTGCGRCVAACPLRLMTLDVRGLRKVATLKDVTCCSACGRCADECLVAALVSIGRS
ncbi:MAG: 4Fe-4S dicluster domain-containing protein [Desulfuromonadales bacterium]|nr:MAG: 4Fe-4S dicluster domain-containing protein [Desulfuromonadales bacterium]